MTIITKPLSDKKDQKVLEPLADDVNIDIMPKRAGARLGVAVKPTVVVRSHKVSSATTAFLFLVALLIMSCGIMTGVYVYSQFARAQGHKFMCAIPYDFGKTSLSSAKLFSSPISFNDDTPFKDEPFLNSKDFFHEQFEIEDDHEKIDVPDFSGGRRSKFIHDFKLNKTGIVDVIGHKCFVMPLNQTQVLPPKDMFDLTRKMMAGYYNVDTAIVHETMRVVVPPIEDRSNLGPFIQRECTGFPIYRLEKIVSGVFKRSVPEGEPVQFAEFAGKSTHILNIINYADIEGHDDVPIAMA